MPVGLAYGDGQPLAAPEASPNCASNTAPDSLLKTLEEPKIEQYSGIRSWERQRAADPPHRSHRPGVRPKRLSRPDCGRAICGGDDSTQTGARLPILQPHCSRLVRRDHVDCVPVGPPLYRNARHVHKRCVVDAARAIPTRQEDRHPDGEPRDHCICRGVVSPRVHDI